MRPPSYGCDLEDGYSCFYGNFYFEDLTPEASELLDEEGEPVIILSGKATFRGQGDTGFGDKSWRVFTFCLAPFNYTKRFELTLWYLNLQLTEYRNSQGKSDTGSVAIMYLEDVPYV